MFQFVFHLLKLYPVGNIAGRLYFPFFMESKLAQNRYAPASWRTPH